MKDVHAMAPAVPRLALGKVGLAGVRKPLVVQRSDRAHTLAATFEVYVDLPEHRKGSDLSRNAQVLAEAIDSTVVRPTSSLEETCARIARELLERHDYAREAEVLAQAEYFRPRGLAPDRVSLEDYLLLGRAWARRGEDREVLRVRRGVGGEAVGMTACPCAMETCRARLAAEFPALASPAFDTLPMITHNQRNRSRLTLVLPEPPVGGDPLGGQPEEVEADTLLDIIEGSQSSPTYAILKRGDEGQMVVNAHLRPRFVEDVLREMLAGTAERFPHLPAATEVLAETRSEESIHKYDVRAEHRATLGELRTNLRREA